MSHYNRHSSKQLFLDHELRYMKTRESTPIEGIAKIYHPRVQIRLQKEGRDKEYVVPPNGWSGNKDVWRY